MYKRVTYRGVSLKVMLDTAVMDTHAILQGLYFATPLQESGCAYGVYPSSTSLSITCI